MIKSKKKTSLTIVINLLAFFFVSISYLLIKDFSLPFNFLNTKELIGGVVIFLFAIAIVYQHLIIPNIKINNDAIIIKTIFTEKKYYLKDIKSFELSDKMPLKWLFITFPAEGMFLEFNNEKIEYIYDDFYSNLWKIKNFIQKIKTEPKRKNNKKNIKRFRVNKIIKGSFLTSFSLTIIGLILFILFIIYKMDLINHFTGSIISLTIFITLVVVYGNLLYYFEFNSNSLIVRNHLFIWYERVFNTTDIKEIAIENPSYRVPDGLRIVLNNHNTKLFLAGSYLNKNWQETIEILNESKIEIRNESLWYLENDEN